MWRADVLKSNTSSDLLELEVWERWVKVRETSCGCPSSVSSLFLGQVLSLTCFFRASPVHVKFKHSWLGSE
jgi:hypothetical protein